jgi:hypothetical protein
MSINQTDRSNDQAIPTGTPPPVFTAETLPQTKVSPPEHFSPPPRRPVRSTGKVWFAVIAVIVVVALIFSMVALVLSLRGQRQETQVIPTPTTPGATMTATPGGDTTPAPTPGVTQGPQSGPPGVSEPAYWDRILGTRGTDGKVEAVSFANVVGTPSLQALVTVRHSDVTRTLDVYVFDHVTNAKPTQLFKLPGLIKGDAKISYYNSVLTAEVDRNSPVNTGKSSDQWTRDLFREFEWNQGEGTLAQVAFPGIFPDLTRYQAEADQASVNQGHQPWKNDPAQVAKALATQFLQWTRPLTTTVTSGGGVHDVYATVRVQEAALQGAQSSGPFINVTLSRLEGNTHNLWVAISVADAQALTIQNIEARSQITNPVKIEGKGSAFEGVIGKAFVLDHLSHDIGHAQVMGIPGVGMGNTTYSTMVLYRTSFTGVQEGIVEVQEDNGGISDEPYSAVMIKVLLTPEPGVALGPLPGPDQAQQSSYWVPIIGVDTSKASVGRPSFANMKGDPSLQALVPVYHTDGSQLVDIYVYDRITSMHPVQLFTLQGLSRGGAIISGYSTILTAQVDRNSSVNRGKTGDNLTTDLYREFKWSDGAGIFVPTAFPGIFPDLTRYQAEMDQNNVKTGQDPWKTNAVQVAQRMATQLLKWPSNAAARLLSGGSPQDVDALVQVKSSSPGGLAINVTLSRLEGNTTNLWVVVSVTSSTGLLTITTPVKGDRLSSPTTITGTGSAFEGVIGRAFVLDHLYTAIGQTQVLGASNGKTTYRATVSYTSSFQGGTQEGIVVVFMYSQADGSIATAAMQKVLLSA